MGPSDVVWTPIDSAPTDGRPLWTRGLNYGKPNNGEHFGWAYWDGAKWAAPDGSTLLYLTHYMERNP